MYDGQSNCNFIPGGMRVSDEPNLATPDGGSVQRLRLRPTKAQRAQAQNGGPDAQGKGPQPAGQGGAQPGAKPAAPKQPGPNAPKAADAPKPAANKGPGAGGKPPGAQDQNRPNPQAGGPKPPQPPAPMTDVAACKPVSAARVNRRHRGVILSLVMLVLIPMALTGWYLWSRAADQYASTVGFSVRTEEVGSAIEILGGITELSGSSSSDTDILFEFLQSQKLVRDIDAQLDLRAIWSKPDNDPVFAYDTSGTIEDLLDHWLRKV